MPKRGEEGCEGGLPGVGGLPSGPSHTLLPPTPRVGTTDGAGPCLWGPQLGQRLARRLGLQRHWVGARVVWVRLWRGCLEPLGGRGFYPCDHPTQKGPD